MGICAEVRWGLPLRTIATVSTQCQHSGGYRLLAKGVAQVGWWPGAMCQAFGFGDC